MAARALAVALALGIACAPIATRAAPAPAGPTKGARQLFAAGSQAYDKGRYLDAVRAFEEAYRLLPDPAVAFSLAQAHRRQFFVDRDPHDLGRAVQLYQKYLEEVSEGGRRADAVEQLQELEPVVLRLRGKLGGDGSPDTVDEPASRATEFMIYTTVPGATASIDDGAFQPVPLLQPTTPGPHAITVLAQGHAPFKSTATAIEGRLIPVEATLRELPAWVSFAARKGARILVDGRELGYAPLPTPVTELPPGRHDLSITALGRTGYRTTVRMTAGKRYTIDAPLPPTRQRRAAWGMLGAGGVLTAAGMVTLGLALHFQAEARELDDLAGERNITEDERNTLNTSITRRDRLRGATIGLLSTAAVSFAVGLVLYLVDRPRASRARRG